MSAFTLSCVRCVGASVKMGDPPRVRCVVLDDATGSPAVDSSFDLTTSGDSTVDQVHDFARQLGARLTGLTANVVVVSRADVAPVASNAAARQTRLLIEGGLLHASRIAGLTTLLRSGKDIGHACGSDKDSALASAKALDSPRREACAAALSGLAKPDPP